MLVVVWKGGRLVTHLKIFTQNLVLGRVLLWHVQWAFNIACWRDLVSVLSW